MTLCREEGSGEDECVRHFTALPPPPPLTTTFRRGGRVEKRDWNLVGRCAIVYAHGDFLFKVLLIAVDGL